jgi:hypothetical protein
MKGKARFWISLAFASYVLVQTPFFRTRAQESNGPGGPDPREIPVPRIKTPMGILPGVNELRVRKDLPDVMVMNDGAKVTNRLQWEKRREEMRRILPTTRSDRCRRLRET